MLKAKEYADSGGVDLSMIVRGCDLKLTYNGEKVGAWEKANELSLQFRKTKADQQSFAESKTVASTRVEGPSMPCVFSPELVRGGTAEVR